MTLEELNKVIEVAERRYPYDPDFTETETNLARLGFVAGAVWMERKREREREHIEDGILGIDRNMLSYIYAVCKGCFPSNKEDFIDCVLSSLPQKK